MSSHSADKDTAAQNRIITHMNADQSDSIIRYVRHYSGLSSFSARNARLTTITFQNLEISSFPYPSKEVYHTIPLDPPLESWAEARARLVEMDADACKGLGCSNITVKTYAPPKGFMAFVFGACLWSYLTFSRRSHFLPGSLYYDYFFRFVPGLASFCYKFQPLMISLMVVLHGAEVIHLAITRLEKHTVPVFSQLWWKWILSDFVEGVGALTRFNRIVNEERLKRERQEH